MPSPSPLLSEKLNSGWEIDTCRPQIKAMRSGQIELYALTKGHYPGTLMKPTQLPGINSIGFWNGFRAQTWGLDEHRNEGLEISFLEAGTMDFSVGEKRYPIHSRNFTVTQPWQLHKLGAPHIGPGKMHWLILDVGVRHLNDNWTWPPWLTLVEADKALLTRKLRQDVSAVWNASPAIASVFSGLAHGVLNWKRPYAESRMIILLNQLFLEILAVLTHQDIHEDPNLALRRHTVQTFLDQLAENAAMDGPSWTLESMAARCGMSVTSFSKYCRELVNNGPVEYLNHCRLNRAARQLRDCPALSIIEIALENGFNSSQYFATVFHRKFRVTPREYRKQAKEPVDSPSRVTSRIK